MTEQALVSKLVADRGNRVAENIIVVGAGVALLAVLAQVSIVLPWTAVPITGQTFGVAFVSLIFGRKRALATTASYLMLGAMGLPIFAKLGSALVWGPTLGYLLGMICASYFVGTLADRGWTTSFLKAWTAATLGSVITFACGLAVLAFFVSSDELLWAGLIPFLPGDVLKNTAAAALAMSARRLRSQK